MVLAPIGWIAFQIFVGYQAGETWVWFRVQRERGRGREPGLTALDRIWGALLHPASSPTNLLTLLSVVAMIGLVCGSWKARLPAPLVACTVAILALMSYRRP